MVTSVDVETKLRELKPALSQRFHVQRLGYFGSFATDQSHADSDLDVLVEFSQPIGWEFFTLEKFLEKEFGMKIDLVTPNALKEKTKASIFRQLKYV
jgi:predicted nucleotidyltransferase